MHGFSFQHVDTSWHPCIQAALASMNTAYLEKLQQSTDWLPGQQNIFNAFSLPINNVRYVLFGESPYPRAQSANGYAFWDADVKNLWSPTGLDKKVNRATSLRNILKMLLIAEGKLTPHATTQPDIVNLDKSDFVQTNHDFFNNFLQQGFLLLNASLVLQNGQKPAKDAKFWQPFIKTVMSTLLEENPHVGLIFFGNIANAIDPLLPPLPVQKLYAEHPYNLSFVTNEDVLSFFKQFSLLRKKCIYNKHLREE